MLWKVKFLTFIHYIYVLLITSQTLNIWRKGPLSRWKRIKLIVPLKSLWKSRRTRDAGPYCVGTGLENAYRFEGMGRLPKCSAFHEKIYLFLLLLLFRTSLWNSPDQRTSYWAALQQYNCSCTGTSLLGSKNDIIIYLYNTVYL